MKKIVLLVEDDPGITRSLQVAFGLTDYELISAPSIEAANEKIERLKPCCLLLDINLPDGSGFDFCKELLAIYPHVPVIMLTARTDEESAVRGLKLGAIDYIRKPFGTRELLAKVDRVVGGAKILRFGPIDLKTESRETTVRGKSVELGRREFEILTLLVREAETVVSREALLNTISAEEETSDRAIDTHLSRIRSKLKKAGAGDVQISSIYGIGYKLSKKAG